MSRAYFKWIIGLLFAFFVFLVAILVEAMHEEPIQVFGELSRPEVVEICSTVRNRIYPPMLPNLSIQSIRAAPAKILKRFTKSNPRIWKIEVRTSEFVAVIGRSPKDAVPKPYVFWGVFRGTNDTWRAEIEYHYP